MTHTQLMKLGKIIDRASDSGDGTTLRKQISDIQEHIENFNDSKERLYSYYFLANAWSGLRRINHEENKQTIWKLEQKEVFKEIFTSF